VSGVGEATGVAISTGRLPRSCPSAPSPQHCSWPALVKHVTPTPDDSIVLALELTVSTFVAIRCGESSITFPLPGTLPQQYKFPPAIAHVR
jgi:hypothetical protein